MTFGERLKILREKYSLKQSELALILGIGRASISNYEVGSRIPDIDVTIKMADYFNVSIDYLVGRVDENTFETLNTVSDWKSTFDKVSNIKDFLGAGYEILTMQILLALNKVAEMCISSLIKTRDSQISYSYINAFEAIVEAQQDIIELCESIIKEPDKDIRRKLSQQLQTTLNSINVIIVQHLSTAQQLEISFLLEKNLRD